MTWPDKCPVCDEPLNWKDFPEGDLKEAVCCYMVYEKHPDDQIYAHIRSTKVPFAP